MRILVSADDSGSLKEIICSRGTDTSSQKAPQPEKIETYNGDGLKNRVQRLLVTKLGDLEVIITARANGQINVYKSETYELINTVSHNLETSVKDQFVSLIESFGKVYTASEQGVITVIDLKTVLEDHITSKSTKVKAPLSTFIAHPRQDGVFAFGGKENDVRIIRLYKEGSDIFENGEIKAETLFQGKNVKNDKLDLRVPIWITNILFIKLEDHTEKSWHLITTTGHGQVRKYDTSHGRKPISDKKLSDKPLVRVATTPKEDEIICADTQVTTALFNIDKGILVAKYKGSVGAVEALYSYTKGNEALLVAGALDRYVRVFDINTREQVAKVYVGSKISSVWLLSAENTAEEDKKVEEQESLKKSKKSRKTFDENEDEDTVWNQLEELEKKTTKKRKT